jgi:hypothetical protein
MSLFLTGLEGDAIALYGMMWGYNEDSTTQRGCQDNRIDSPGTVVQAGVQLKIGRDSVILLGLMV